MEMMPKDIKREFLRRPRKFEEIMEKLEITINEMLADNGPVPLDLGNVGTHDVSKLAKEQARKDHTVQERGIEERS